MMGNCSVSARRFARRSAGGRQPHGGGAGAGAETRWQAQGRQEGWQKVMHLNLPRVSLWPTSTAGAGGAQPGQAEPGGAARRKSGL